MSASEAAQPMAEAKPSKISQIIMAFTAGNREAGGVADLAAAGARLKEERHEMLQVRTPEQDAHR